MSDYDNGYQRAMADVEERLRKITFGYLDITMIHFGTGGRDYFGCLGCGTGVLPYKFYDALVSVVTKGETPPDMAENYRKSYLDAAEVINE